LIAEEKDFFDVRGTQEAYDRLKRLYTLLGAPDRVKLFVGPRDHGYHQDGREAMYQWFNHVTRVSEAMKEPDIVIEKDETLWCTPRGQVAELNPRTVSSFTREKAKAIAAARIAIAGDDLKRTVTEILKLPVRPGTPEFRILRPVRSRSYPTLHATRYAVETEAGIHALVYRLSKDPLYSRPPRGAKRAVLYIAHRSSDAELRTEPLVGEAIASEPEVPFFACDVRGIGESQPDIAVENQFLAPFGSDYMYAIHSFMLDYPYVGQRTNDVLRVLDWLKSYGHAEIHLVAVGWGTIPATFAALLSEQVVQVTLKDHLTSYQEIAESERYEWPLSSLLPGVLKKFDLPDCYAALTGKKLRMIVPAPQ
jgi:hypothetical protein